jgi:hypothetical protein
LPGKLVAIDICQILSLKGRAKESCSWWSEWRFPQINKAVFSEFLKATSFSFSSAKNSGFTDYSRNHGEEGVRAKLKRKLACTQRLLCCTCVNESWQGCKPAPQLNLLTCVTAARRGSTADHSRLPFTTQRGPANGSISPNQVDGTALPFWQNVGCSSEFSARIFAISGWVVSPMDCNRTRGVGSGGDA